MINRCLAGVGCLGMAGLLFAGVLSKHAGALDEAAALAVATGCAGLALLQLSTRARGYLFHLCRIRP